VRSHARTHTPFARTAAAAIDLESANALAWPLQPPSHSSVLPGSALNMSARHVATMESGTEAQGAGIVHARADTPIRPSTDAIAEHTRATTAPCCAGAVGGRGGRGGGVCEGSL
jgi:hypothetical protein